MSRRTISRTTATSRGSSARSSGSSIASTRTDCCGLRRRGVPPLACYARDTGRRVRTYDARGRGHRVIEIRPGRTPSSSTSPASATDAGHVRVGALIGKHMALNATLPSCGRRTRPRPRHRDGVVGVVRRRAPSLRVARDGGGVRVFDDYAHHPTEIAASFGRQGGDRCGPAGRGVPAGHLQPHPDLRPRVRRRDGPRRHRGRDGHLPGPRGTDPRRHRRHDRRPHRVARGAGRLRTALRRGARSDRRARAAGDLVITMGIGNVYLLCDAIRESASAGATPAPA